MGRPARTQPARTRGENGQPLQTTPDATERPTPYYWVSAKLRNRYPSVDWAALCAMIRADWESDMVLVAMRSRVARHFNVQMSADTVRMLAYAASDHRRGQGRQRLTHLRSEAAQVAQLDAKVAEELRAQESERLALPRRCPVCEGRERADKPHHHERREA